MESWAEMNARFGWKQEGGCHHKRLSDWSQSNPRKGNETSRVTSGSHGEAWSTQLFNPCQSHPSLPKGCHVLKPDKRVQEHHRQMWLILLKPCTENTQRKMVPGVYPRFNWSFPFGPGIYPTGVSPVRSEVHPIFNHGFSLEPGVYPSFNWGFPSGACGLFLLQLGVSCWAWGLSQLPLKFQYWHISNRIWDISNTRK